MEHYTIERRSIFSQALTSHISETESFDSTLKIIELIKKLETKPRTKGNYSLPLDLLYIDTYIHT